MSLKNSIIVLWVYVMYGLGMWIFFSGYLLKRIVVHKHNLEISNFISHAKCHDYTSLHTLSETFHVSNNATPPNVYGLKRFDKTVIIIIDALRYDFTVFGNSTPEDPYYVNKMPVFSDITGTTPEQCLWTKLIADPPTTTLQRLTGLTTGSLPTFIDISMNFASTNILEDNLVWQLNNSGKKIVFMGDDTWEGLFPNQFHRSFPYPSFNVKDLDTVDNGILANIYKELEKPDWDVIIAHFLGVDHCGHRYGPNHPAMANKLQQMDHMIRNVTKMIKNDTLLVVLGDHGMTQSGDHGGDSPDETATALFLYTQSNLTPANEVRMSNSSVLQIDLVPTLSLLLGIPIPFSNLGSIMPQVFTATNLNSGEPCFDETTDSLIGGAIATAENAFQVHHYLKEYVSVSDDFSSFAVSQATDMLKNVSKLWERVLGNDPSSLAILHELREGYKEYLVFVQSQCQSKWAKFDVYSMVIGTLVLFLSVAINLIYAYNWTIKVPVKKLFMFIVTVCIAVVFCMQNFYIFIIFCFAVFCMLSYCLQEHFKWMCLCICKLLTFPNIIFMLITFNNFSNSYVVYEDRIMLFLLQTLISSKLLLSIFSAFHTSWSGASDKVKKGKSSRKNNYYVWVFPATLLCLLILIRLSSVFRKCREEQVLCETSLFLTSLESVVLSTSSYPIMRLCLSWVSILVPVIALLVSCNYMHKERDFSVASISLAYGVPFIAVCICFHWWLSMVPTEVLDRILGQNQVAPARCALVACVLMFFASWIFPLMPEKPLECPTNRIYIGSMMLFGASMALPLYLMAGDGLALSISMMIVTLVIVLVVNGFLGSSESPPDVIVVLWAISSCHWFYSTGHQPTFPSLHWNAAFIVSKEVVSHFLSGTFVIINTFSSQIFHGITLPLLLLSSSPPKLPETPLFYLIMKYLSIHGFKLVGSVLACFVLRRHLMVWKIFTPKLIYDAVGFCVTAVSVFVSYIFVVRVITCLHKQIKKSAGQLWFLKDD